jgi:choline-sulfatase
MIRWLAGAALAAAWLAALDVAPVAGEAALADLAWLWLAALCMALAVQILPTVIVVPLGKLPPLERLGRALDTRPWRSRALGLVLVAAGTVAHRLDATLYVRLYLSLHLALAVAALGLCAGGFALLLVRRQRAAHHVPGRALLRRTAVGGAILVWAVLAGLSLVRTIESPVRRYLAVERTTMLGHGLLLLHDRWGILGAGDDPIATGIAAAELAPQVRARHAPAPRRHHVLLITVDAMRADSLPPGGAMARLAREGVRFTRAYAASCWTLHSMTATLTSRLPGQLAWTPVSVAPDLKMTPHATDDALVTNPANWKKTTPVPWDEPTPTLARLLGEAGWQTMTPIAYVFYLPQAGVTRDFQLVDERPLREHNLDNQGVTSTALTDAALAFLAARDPARPFFLWVHYMDPHAPYLAQDPSAQGQDARARYASELRHVDRELGRLLDDLRTRGLLDDTIVILHADHGEEFGEHGGQYHATTVYDEQLRVPLVIRAPGVAAGERHTPVSALDLVPTVLDLVGVAPDAPTVGLSLADALLAGGESKRRLVYGDCTRFGRSRRMLVDGDHKFIVDRTVGTFEVYDLSKDPTEQRNLMAAPEPSWMRRAELLDHMP